MRTDSKHDGIKHEHVIFTQACPRSRQRRARLCQCECFSQSSWGRGGGCEKLCVPLEKFWLRPCIVLYSSPVSTFIPSKSQQTEKSGEGIDFSLRENMDLRWPEPIYMCVGYVLKSRFSAGKMGPISMILVILNNE